MTNEWGALPKPENIDKVLRTWTVTLEEFAALRELLAGEECGRHRFARFEAYITKKIGASSSPLALEIIVQRSPLSS